MLTKVRLLSTAAVLAAVTSTGALAESTNPVGTYMGPSLSAQPAPAATAAAPQTPAPVVTAQATTSNTAPNYYSPYGAASMYPSIPAAPEGSGTNSYTSGVGTSGHAPLR